MLCMNDKVWTELTHSMNYVYLTENMEESVPNQEKIVKTENGIWYENPLISKPRFFQTQASVVDVYCDPVTDVVELWTLDHGKIKVLDPHKEFNVPHEENTKLFVLDRNTCIVSGDQNKVYHKGQFQTDYTRKVTKTCFLYDINKYMIQNERDFVILNRWTESDPMVFTHDGSPITFHAHQRIVLYIHRYHLCVAETDFPYRIIIKRVPRLCYSSIMCAPNHIMLTSGRYKVFLSMFPMSFTDSTRILTTFE